MATLDRGDSHDRETSEFLLGSEKFRGITDDAINLTRTEDPAWAHWGSSHSASQ